jgi:hypothetical protein
MTTYDPSKYKHKPSPKHTLEEVLKSLQDLIRNDLLDAKPPAAKPEPALVSDDAAVAAVPAPEKSRPEPAAPVREDFAPITPESGPVNLNAVMRSLKDLIHNELDTGEEPAPADAAEPEPVEAPVPPLDAQLAPADADEAKPEEYIPEEPAPLEEELTLDETAAAVPAAPPASTLPELPGDIEPELIDEPKTEPVPAPPVIMESVGPGKTKTPAGMQQELPFDMPPAPAVEARLPPRKPAPPPAPPSNAEPMPAPETAPGSDKPVPAAEPEAALPTIDVEEDFDAAAYFETAPETAAIAPEPQDAAPVPEKTTPTPAAEPPVAPPPETKTTLELAIEPTAENTPAMPAVDFDNLDLQPPRQEPPAPAAGGAKPAPDGEAPPPITEASAPATTETAAETPPTAQTASGTEAVKTEPQDDAAPAANPAPFSIDDIPVLKEVVAPPAGGALLIEPPAAHTPPLRPSPDRTRDLVVRAVARLNVEMRRSGGVGLDTKTILRLQQLIREELGKDGEI